MYASGGAWQISNSVFRANQAVKTQNEVYLNRGGAVLLNGGTHFIFNSIFAGNTALGSGSAIRVEGAAAKLAIVNTTVAGNTGGGALDVVAGTVAVTNSLFWQNEGDIAGTVALGNSLTQDGYAVGLDGNISADPLFERGLYLSANSPARNAGVGTATEWGLASLTTTADGTPDGDAVDLGYHFAAGIDPRYADLYVTPGGANENDGRTWETALPSVTRALALARDGTRIHIGTGVYTNSAVAETFPLNIADKWDLQVLGETPEATSLKVVGGTRVRLLNITHAVGVALQRLKFCNGYPPDNESGGAIYMQNSAGIVITDCSFEDNQIYRYTGTIQGGALYATSCSGSLNDARFVGNASRNGYGASSQYSEAGAMYALGGSWQISNCVFRANQAVKTQNEVYLNRGGAVLLNGGTHFIFNSVFAGNAALGSGSAIRVEGATTKLTIANTTVAGNTGGVALDVSAATVDVVNSIFWQNDGDIAGTVALGNSLTQDGYAVGLDGNISADPLFERGLYLSANSPARNAGVGTATEWGLAGLTTTADGAPDGDAVDMGHHFAAGIDPCYADLYVTPGGANENDGRTWETALASVTHALALAHDGTRIHIGAGVYTNSAVAETFPLKIADKWGVRLLGAGADTTTLKVVSGARASLFAISNTAGDSLIKGLCFSSGAPADNTLGGAGSVYYGQVTFVGCAFRGNNVTATGFTIASGGGLYCFESLLELSDSVFSGNRAYSKYGAPNGGSGLGGALCLQRGRSRIGNVEMVGNIANKSQYENTASRGGACAFVQGQHEIYNTLLASNMTTGAGSALYTSGARVVLYNTTIADNYNTAALSAGGGTIGITNSIFWGHVGGDFVGVTAEEFAYSIATVLVDNVNGNLSGDPLFMGAGDYRLQEGSPAQDAGIRLSWMEGATDLAGARRISVNGVDIGAYEIQAAPATLLLIR